MPRTEGQKINGAVQLPESRVILDYSCPSWRPQRDGEEGKEEDQLGLHLTLTLTILTTLIHHGLRSPSHNK